MQGEEGVLIEEAHPLRPWILATYASALAHSGATAEAIAKWSEVQQSGDAELADFAFVSRMALLDRPSAEERQRFEALLATPRAREDTEFVGACCGAVEHISAGANLEWIHSTVPALAATASEVLASTGDMDAALAPLRLISAQASKFFLGLVWDCERVLVRRRKRPFASRLYESFSAGEIRNGYIAAIRATEKQVDPAGLRVVEKELREADGAGGTRPFTQFDYMLFRVEIFEERDDWEALSYIDEPCQQAIDALQSDDDKKADLFIKTALRRAMSAPDLTEADRRRVVDKLKERYKAAREQLQTSPRWLSKKARRPLAKFWSCRFDRLGVTLKRGAYGMRMMMHMTIPVETGNEAAKSGMLGKTLSKILSDLKPEAAYFMATESGERGGFIVFDMKDSSEIPGITEPFFLAFNAKIQMWPAMSAQDLANGMPGLERAVKEFARAAGA